MLNYDERRGLLQFVPQFFLQIPILVIETAEILPDVRKILPNAQIAFLSEKISSEQKKICDDVRADIFTGDWTIFSAETKIFELIIAPEILSAEKISYAQLLTLNRLLKDSGALITKFSTLREKFDVVKRLDDALFKEIIFSGEFIRANRCSAEVAALKSLFTPEIRAELSRILHRIEYDIDAEENLRRLAEICRREGIFAEYLTDFIEQVVVHASAKKFLLERVQTPQVVLVN